MGESREKVLWWCVVWVVAPHIAKPPFVHNLSKPSLFPIFHFRVIRLHHHHHHLPVHTQLSPRPRAHTLCLSRTCNFINDCFVPISRAFNHSVFPYLKKGLHDTPNIF